jgi:eukaryotic-like serine/threonine-protein kinase
MTDDPRVEQLVDELIDPRVTPEVVCATCPELLPAVRRRWRQMRRLGAALDALFPPPTETPPHPPDEPGLPQIPGYEVEAVLGRGGMGVVFRARHLRLNRPVALKMILAGAYAAPQEVERFLREAEAVAGLRHPNVVQVYDVGEVGGRPYFTMELVEGGRLTRKLAGAPLPARQAAALVAAVAEAIQAAHQRGIIHRDLTPANVLLSADGMPKVTDFGLAKRLEAGGGLTLSGVPMGTPSYMAPEQARGDKEASRPAADVYGLGAILYECLTGRPPFRAATGAETVQQVIAQEPAPPSRLNAQVPRDLETICLKCLNKSPSRRYTTAQDLSDDLRRFLEGKPILARRVGVGERAVKWARRRPAAALLVAASIVMLGLAAGTAFSLRQQEVGRQSAKEQRQRQACDVVETALKRADDLAKEERWKEALRVLKDASPQLADADSPSLDDRLRRAQSDFRIAEELENARETYLPLPNASIDYVQRGREFLKAFEHAGLSLEEDAETVAGQVRSSAIRDQLIAAIEDRAVMAYVLLDKPLTARSLTIARLADPGSPWRDRFRDSSLWGRNQLQELAATAFTSSPPPTEHQLVLLALLMKANGDWRQGARLLEEVSRRQPRNFWAHREMGYMLARQNRHQEAANYLRVAVSLRPDNAGAYEGLALCLFRSGQLDDAIARYRQAVEVSRSSGSVGARRARLVEVLAQAGYWKDADTECRLALEEDRSNYLAPFRLAEVLLRAKRADEALIPARRATEIAPDVPDTHALLGAIYSELGRHEDAVTVQRALTALPSAPYLARLWLARYLAAVGRWEEAIDVLQTGASHQPAVAAYRCETGLILRAHGKPEEAAKAFQKAATINAADPLIWNGLAGSLLDQGRFAEARAAIQSSLKLPAQDAERQERQRQLALCDSLLAVEAKLPAILAGKELLNEAATQRALAEWCLRHKRLTATAARFYASAFAAQPSLADDLKVGNRSHAGRAAALAGCGMGEDAAHLDDRQRAELRRQALDWLTAEYSAWAERHRLGKPGDRTIAATAVRSWLKSEDLAGLRDERALARLPTEETHAWQALWEKVAALALRDPVAKFDQARIHVSRTEWEKAVRRYAEELEIEPTDDSNVWFEYAAAQLLAGDRAGYRRTCAHMLVRCQPAGPMRPFLVARACTLAPDSFEDAARAALLSQNELLERNSGEFWSLTELGALRSRSPTPKDAIPFLEKSLVVDGRPGRAVLNWLWLAIVHQQLGSSAEARQWLEKAAHWFDQQGGQTLMEDPVSGAYLHNWLEAHVLRGEAEALMQPAERPSGTENRERGSPPK